MQKDTEKQLIERAKTDRAAFGELFDRYYPVILQYIARRVGDISTAQDITAETFLKAMTNIHKFEWQGISISSWFYKIATNELRMYYRKTNYVPTSLDVLFEDGIEVADEQNFVQEIIEAQDALDREQQFKQVQTVLTTLPLKYQEVIALRYGEHKKLDEIATILDKRTGTIKSLLSRGLGKLRTGIEQQKMQPNPQADIIASAGRELLITSQEAYEE